MNRNKTDISARWGLVLTLYLLGIFMGAIDTGIVTPARTVIQNNLGVNEVVGIWMITIYTLAYAAAIPVMGKLADRFGKKNLYIISIILFGLGSIGCGLSQDFESFSMLLVSRVVQAIGGGGIVPIATAAVGVIVPSEKRGMALGLVGGVYGVANVFGAAAGSLILNVAGVDNWQWVFYVNIPIALFVVCAGVFVLPEDGTIEKKRIDYIGIALVVLIVTALLWAIQHIDFFNILATIRDVNVWGSLLAVLIMLPIFIAVELHTDDPVIDFRYFTKLSVALTLLLALLSGMMMMAFVFMPHFAENSMRLPAGYGGYPMIIFGLASGVGAPISGRLTDKFGPRAVIAVGVVVSGVVAVALNFWSVPYPSYTSVITCLTFMGLGFGFLVGAPLNYLMLHLLPDSQATSGLANLSLVRAFGTTMAPAILVGLFANSTVSLPDKIIEQMPASVTIAGFPHAQELQSRFDEIKENPQLAEKLGGVLVSDFSRTTYVVSIGSESEELPEALSESLRTADINNVMQRSVAAAEYIFDQRTSEKIEHIQAEAIQDIDTLKEGRAHIERSLIAAKAQGRPADSYTHLDASLKEIDETISWLQEFSEALPTAFEQGKVNYEHDLQMNKAHIERTLQLELNKGFSNIFWFYAAAAFTMFLLLLGVPGKKKIDAEIQCYIAPKILGKKDNEH